MKWKAKKSTFRTQAVARPVDSEEEREDWKQSLSIIPDFDLSSIDSESKIEALIHSTDLVLKQPDEGE
jgi:hypothetical protein